MMELSSKMLSLLLGAGLSVGVAQAMDDKDYSGESLIDRVTIETAADDIDFVNGGCGNSGCGNGGCGNNGGCR